MFNYLEWMKSLTQQTHTNLIFFLSIIIVVFIVDFLLGFTIANLDKRKKFSSTKAILGIVRKIGIIILLVLVIPISIILPDMIALPAIYIFYAGILWAEIRSVLSHLGLSADDKQDNKQMIKDVFNNMFGGK